MPGAVGKWRRSCQGWIASRGATFKQRHLIPQETRLYQYQPRHFDAFVHQHDTPNHSRLEKLLAEDTPAEN